MTERERDERKENEDGDGATYVVEGDGASAERPVFEVRPPKEEKTEGEGEGEEQSDVGRLNDLIRDNMADTGIPPRKKRREAKGEDDDDLSDDLLTLVAAISGERAVGPVRECWKAHKTFADAFAQVERVGAKDPDMAKAEIAMVVDACVSMLAGKSDDSDMKDLKKVVAVCIGILSEKGAGFKGKSRGGRGNGRRAERPRSGPRRGRRGGRRAGLRRPRGPGPARRGAQARRRRDDGGPVRRRPQRGVRRRDEGDPRGAEVGGLPPTRQI